MYQQEGSVALAPQMLESLGSQSPSQLEQASSLLYQQLCALLSRTHIERDVFYERRDKQVREHRIWNAVIVLGTCINAWPVMVSVD